MSVTGRSSSITNAFINAIIPVIEPTYDEEIEALRILEISPEDIRCAYCGDKFTEWDHLRPIISNQEPTGRVAQALLIFLEVVQAHARKIRTIADPSHT
jgi:hypothetical protein